MTTVVWVVVPNFVLVPINLNPILYLNFAVTICGLKQVIWFLLSETEVFLPRLFFFLLSNVNETHMVTWSDWWPPVIPKTTSSVCWKKNAHPGWYSFVLGISFSFDEVVVGETFPEIRTWYEFNGIMLCGEATTWFLKRLVDEWKI